MKRLSYLILIGIAISSIQSKLYAQKNRYSHLGKLVLLEVLPNIMET